eukprot:1467588-Lingulodinium_polyedra.AAC.1
MLRAPMFPEPDSGAEYNKLTTDHLAELQKARAAIEDFVSSWEGGAGGDKTDQMKRAIAEV